MSVRALFQPLRSLAAASISASYAKLGSIVPVPFRLFRINNATAGNLFFSTDGVNDMMFVQAGAAVIYDISTNRELEPVFAFPAQTQMWVRQSTTPVSGAAYFEVIYGPGT